MKSVLSNWWMALIAAVFGGIGWFAKDVNLNGVTGAGEPMALGGLTIGGGLALAWLMFSKWQTAGGKFDGKVTDAEFDAITDTLMERLAPQLKPVVDKLQPVIVPAINNVVGPTATSIIHNLLGWFKDTTPDPDEPALNFTVLHVLEDAQGLKADPEALAAIALLKSKVASAALLPATPAAVSVVN